MSYASYGATHTAQGTTERTRVRRQLTQLVTCSEASLRGKWTLHRIWGHVFLTLCFLKLYYSLRRRETTPQKHFPPPLWPLEQGQVPKAAYSRGRFSLGVFLAAASPVCLGLTCDILTVPRSPSVDRCTCERSCKETALPKGRAEAEDST